MPPKPSYEALQKRIAQLERKLKKKEQELEAAANKPSSQQKELLNQAKFIKTLFDTIPSPFFYKDTNGIYRGCNQAFSTLILGVPPDRIVGCSLYDLPEQIPKKLADIYYRQDQALLNHPGLQVYEAKVKCADGLTREYIFYKSTFPDHTGKVAGIVGLMLDVTEKNEIQLKLKESEEKYRSMMESMSDAVYICSPNLTISYMNTKMREHIGYDATGEKCHKVLHDLEEPCSWCSFQKVRQGMITEAEVTSPKNGRTYIVSNSPIYHQDGSLSKMTIYRDITNRLKLEKELLTARKLESAGIFAGGIAHDYNNLLFIILGNLLMLKREVDDTGMAAKLLKDAEEAAQRAASLTKRLLAFTHDEALTLENIALDKIIEEAVTNNMDTKKFSVQLELPQKPLMAQVDSGLINKVLSDILENCKDAMKQGGTIQVAATRVKVSRDSELLGNSVLDRPGDYVQISISDQGCGIDDKIKAHIFDPYFSTKERGTQKGLGLGLATSYSIIKKHGGAILVDSSQDAGTKVSLYLPVANPAAATTI